MNSVLGKQIRVVLVDDHPIVRNGLTRLIEQEPDLAVCGEAANMRDALALIKRENPDLAIIDISLDDASGVDLMKAVKEVAPATKMLAISMHDEGLYAERVLRAGGMGFVRKNNALDVLIDAIRDVLAGNVYLSDSMKNRLLQQLAKPADAAGERPEEALSNRELEVFEQIGHGLTTREIANRMHLSIKTIETYRENVKKKLGLKNAAELGRHAVRWLLESS